MDGLFAGAMLVSGSGTILFVHQQAVPDPRQGEEYTYHPPLDFPGGNHDPQRGTLPKTTSSPLG